MVIYYSHCLCECTPARATSNGFKKAFQAKTSVQVLDAVMRYSDRTAGEEGEQAGQQVEVLHWAAAIDDTGQLSNVSMCHFAGCCKLTCANCLNMLSRCFSYLLAFNGK